MAEIHAFVDDPIASTNLPTERRDLVNKAFLQISKYSLLGHFKEAHDHLERLGAEAKALPGYFALLAETHIRQGANAQNAIRQALERIPSGCTHSEFKDYCELFYELCRATTSNLDRALELSKKVYEEWLRDKSPDEYGCLKVRLLHLYIEASAKSWSTQDTEAAWAISTATNLFESWIKHGRGFDVDEIGFRWLHDVKDGHSELLPRLISIVLDTQLPLDWTRLSILGMLHLLHGKHLISRKDMNGAKQNFDEARNAFEQCGRQTGVLSVEFLTGLHPFSHNSVGGFDLNAKLSTIFAEAGELQYFELQELVLQLRVRLSRLSPDPENSLELAYQWRDLYLESGHKLHPTTLMSLAQYEVLKTDDVEEVLGYCSEIEESLDGDKRDEFEMGLLQVRMLAYAQLKSHDQAIHHGNVLLQKFREKGYAFNQPVAEAIITVQQSHIGRLGQAQHSSFVTVLEQATNFLDEQIVWLDLQEEKETRSLIALSFCASLVRIFKLSLNPYRSDNGITLVPTRRAVEKYLEQITDVPDDRNLAILCVQGEVLTWDGRFQEAIDLLTERPRIDPSAFRQDTEDIPPLDKYYSACWRVEEAEIFPERSGVEKMTRSTADLETCIDWWEFKLKESGRGSFISMLVSCYYFLGNALRLQGRFLSRNQEYDMAKESFQKGYAAYHRCTGLIDDLRDEPHGSALDAYMAQTQVLAEGRTSIASLANAAFSIVSDEGIWDWVQWAKGRGLAHMLLGSFNMDDIAFERYLDDVDAMSADTPFLDIRMDAMTMFGNISQLQQRVSKARFPDRLQLKEQLIDAKQECSNYPELQGCLTVALGNPASIPDVIWMSKQGNPKDCMTFVDFFSMGRGIFFTYIRIKRWGESSNESLSCPPEALFAMGRDGGFDYSGWHKPVQIQGLTIDDVEDWKETYLQKRELLRPTALEDFIRLTPIIKPVLEYCDRDWLLVVSLNSVLNGIPLHAIPTGEPTADGGKEVLIDRNPVVYTPSMAALRQCVSRARRRNVDPAIGCRNASFIGVYDSNTRFYDELQTVADLMSTEATYGPDTDKTRFLYKASTSTNIFHFHGHQRNEDQPFSERYLELGSSAKFGVRDIANIKFPDKCAPLVMLMACSSADQRLLVGDEALGLIPLFLSAGASSVLGTLWSSHWPSSMSFSRHFYTTYRTDEQDSTIPLIDLSRAVQQAIIALKWEKPAPYFWAPFILTGSWFRRKPTKVSEASD